MIAKCLVHNGRRWEVIFVEKMNCYFARFGNSDTGPYSTAEQAEEFIRAICP